MASIKWPKKDLKYIRVPLYNQIIWFVTDETVFAKVRDYLNMDMNGRSAGVTIDAVNPNGQQIFLVGIFDGSHSTLVHEIIHCVDILSRYLGWDMSQARGEPAAYLAGFLYDELGALLTESNKAAEAKQETDKLCEMITAEKDEVSTNSRKRIY